MIAITTSSSIKVKALRNFMMLCISAVLFSIFMRSVHRRAVLPSARDAGSFARPESILFA
jgi:hypothetical protein